MKPKKFDIIKSQSDFNEVLNGLNSLVSEEEMMKIMGGKIFPVDPCKECVACSSSCVTCTSSLL
jgi:hypothetical protein